MLPEIIMRILSTPLQALMVLSQTVCYLIQCKLYYCISGEVAGGHWFSSARLDCIVSWRRARKIDGVGASKELFLDSDRSCFRIQIIRRDRIPWFQQGKSVLCLLWLIPKHQQMLLNLRCSLCQRKPCRNRIWFNLDASSTEALQRRCKFNGWSPKLATWSIASCLRVLYKEVYQFLH